VKRINQEAEISKDKVKVKVEFSGRNITPYGGFGLFGKFVRKLGAWVTTIFLGNGAGHCFACRSRKAVKVSSY
jgi:hypothetical protein